MLKTLLLVSLFVATSYGVGYFRLANALGQSVTFSGIGFADITLAANQVSPYTAEASGVITVNTVTTTGGTNLLNVTQGLQFDGNYDTFGVVTTPGNNTVFFIIFPEAFSPDVDNAYANQSIIRVINLSGGNVQLSAGSPSSTYSNIAGYLAASNYTIIEPSISSINVLDSSNGNAVLATIPATLLGNNGYTVFVMPGNAGVISQDRQFNFDGPAVTTGVIFTSSVLPVTTGEELVVATSSQMPIVATSSQAPIVATSSVRLSTGSVTASPVATTASASSIKIVGAFVALAAILAF